MSGENDDGTKPDSEVGSGSATKETSKFTKKILRLLTVSAIFIFYTFTVKYLE